MPVTDDFIFDPRDGEEHPISASAARADERGVDAFATAMKMKLAKKRGEGRGGWDHPTECSQAMLLDMLRDHLEKGDMVDIGNFAMMIFNRQQAGLS